MLVNHSLSLFLLSLFLPSSLPLPFLSPSTIIQELMEACQYGLVEQVHYFIKTGVNVNMADFVSYVSTCEGHITYMNSHCRYVYSQYV